MKKYVLNIERLYSGQTANALVLKQVDEDFPVLLPSVPEDEEDLLGWIAYCRKIHPEFTPPSPILMLTREQLNECIIDFNLGLQAAFKSKGRQELYMMDDTGKKIHDRDDSSTISGKRYLHSLNGVSELKSDDDADHRDVNSS